MRTTIQTMKAGPTTDQKLISGKLLPYGACSASQHQVIEEAMDVSNYSLRIRQLRNRRGMSRAVLADFVGRTERWLYDVETGRATPSLADISKMAFALRYPEPVVAGWAPVSEDQDVNRRHFLKLGAVAATATAFDGRLPDPTSPDLSHAVDEFTSKFRGLDNQHGGGFGKAVATDYLEGRIMPLVRRGTYSDGVGQQLWKSTARLAHLVAWMEFDTEGHEAADNSLSTALKLATAANDTAFAAEILAGSSHHALHLGNHTLAIESARAAQRIARDSDIPALMAEAHIAEAHGLALRGDGPAAAAALHSAEQQMDRPTADPLPDWLSYFDEGYMVARVAHVLRDLGDWQGSTRFAEHALDMSPGLARAQAFNTLILADAQLGEGEVDQACQLGSKALDLAGSPPVAAHPALPSRLPPEIESDR